MPMTVTKVVVMMCDVDDAAADDDDDKDACDLNVVQHQPKQRAVVRLQRDETLDGHAGAAGAPLQQLGARGVVHLLQALEEPDHQRVRCVQLVGVTAEVGVPVACVLL